MNYFFEERGVRLDLLQPVSLVRHRTPFRMDGSGPDGRLADSHIPAHLAAASSVYVARPVGVSCKERLRNDGSRSRGLRLDGKEASCGPSFSPRARARDRPGWCFPSCQSFWKTPIIKFAISILSHPVARVPIRALGLGFVDHHAWAALGLWFPCGRDRGHPRRLWSSVRSLCRLLSRRAVWVAIGPWCGFVFFATGFFGLWLASQIPDSLTSWVESQIPDSLKMNLHVPESWKGGWMETVFCLGFGAGSGRDSGLWLAVAGAGRPSACGADRPVASGFGPRLAHRAGLCRLALRQFLGGHVHLAKLFFRSSVCAPGRGCRESGGSQRLRRPRSLMVRCGVASCSTRCWWPG